MKKTRFGSFFSQIVAGLIFSASVLAAELPSEYKYRGYESMHSAAVQADRNFWLEASYASSINPTLMFSGKAGIGFQYGFLGFDIQGVGGLTRYGGIYVKPGPMDILSKQTEAFVDSNEATAEVNRTRNLSDMWTFVYGNAGISVRARLFASLLPNFIQIARVSFGAGPFIDSANGLSFLGFVYSYEAALQYLIGSKNRFALQAAFAQHGGWMSLASASSYTLGRLPLSWFSMNLGFVLYF